jgi:hypothetical protein
MIEPPRSACTPPRPLASTSIWSRSAADPAPAQVLRGFGNVGPAGRFAGVNRLTLCR